MSEESFTLPPGPSDLCFDTNEFANDNFSVDEFLHKYRNAGSLEQMRDDLGVYLKVLRHAMIELINDDYQDFVNLSSELVGFDKDIDVIQDPLLKLRDQIVDVKQELDSGVDEVQGCLEEKRKLLYEEKKAADVVAINGRLSRIRSLLNDHETVDLPLLERVSMDYVQLDHFLTIHKINDDRKFEADDLQNRILDHLRSTFLQSLHERDIKSTERCLKIYLLLDKCIEAEEVFKKDVVVPVMSQLISETSLQNNPQGLVGIYNRIIEFCKTKLVDVIQAAKIVGGFEFLLNSFWSEIEKRLELHLSSIFAPGNPDQFHQKFVSTLSFLDTIEQYIDNPKRFREHRQYKSFLTKWNLPVYFQIRFQEIGALLEAACSKPINKELFCEGEEFKLEPYNVTLKCIKQSWSEKVFLPQLFGRFFKLTLQFVSRLTTWTNEAMEADLKNESLTLSKFLMTLYVDINTMNATSPTILDLVLTNLPKDGLAEQKTLAEQCFKESVDNLVGCLQIIETKIAQDMIANSLPYIKQANDIPRLYRKTNRDIPTKNCAYVDHTLTAAKDFHKQNAAVLGTTKCNQFLQIVFSKLTEQYYAAVKEVLTSVQKTEESLRRLKNLRERSGTTATSSTATERQGMSDDDKIRLQLQVDVIYWASQIEGFGINLDGIDCLTALKQLVEEATKIQTSSD